MGVCSAGASRIPQTREELHRGLVQGPAILPMLCRGAVVRHRRDRVRRYRHRGMSPGLNTLWIILRDGTFVDGWYSLTLAHRYC